MVQKSKVLGQSDLIFVTVGTTQFPFDRLFKTIDHIIVHHNLQFKVILQCVNSNYVWKYKNIKQVRYLSPNDMRSYFKIAKKCIMHGGCGIMHDYSQVNKNMPLIVARCANYKEHIDNHQVFFLDYCKKKISSQYVQFFVTDHNLNHSIEQFLTNENKTNILNKDIFKNSKEKLFKNLLSYIKLQYENTYYS